AVSYGCRPNSAPVTLAVTSGLRRSSHCFRDTILCLSILRRRGAFMAPLLSSAYVFGKHSRQKKVPPELEGTKKLGTSRLEVFPLREGVVGLRRTRFPIAGVHVLRVCNEASLFWGGLASLAARQQSTAGADPVFRLGLTRFASHASLE